MLDYLCRVFLRPEDSIINCPPTFGMYSFDAGLVGAKVIEIWRQPDYSIDVEAIEKRIAEPQDKGERVKMLFLTSPNNPTGNLLSDSDLQRLLALPLLVILDEAYVEFADHPRVQTGFYAMTTWLCCVPSARRRASPVCVSVMAFAQVG